MLAARVAGRCSSGRRAWAAPCGRAYHVAVVGSGPGGFYTTKYLFRQAEKAGIGQLRVDMYERLPTPFGLVRFGVAPDHPEVKNVVNDFTEVATTPGFRFFGNVDVGATVPLATLRSAYDAVIICIGAQGERLLGIPGEDLPGVLGAPAFVKWYNGHPDHAALDPGMPGEAATVLGQGNVALDVARLLTRAPRELETTDIDPTALARIVEWQRQGLRTVQVVGRRGFAQAAFTNAELRELGTCSDEVLPIVDPAELALSRTAASEEELKKSRAKKRSVDILEKYAANFDQRDTTSKRVIWLRFLLSPSEFLPSAAGNRVAGIRYQRNELQGEAGKQRAVKAAGHADVEVPSGLVIRSVGFAVSPFEGLPLDDRTQLVPHTNGRVEEPAERIAEAGGSLYVSGWVKRGPTGIIGTNVGDAQETSARCLMDLKERGQPPKSEAERTDLEALLGKSGSIVSFDDWQRLNAEEKRKGSEAGRTAIKFTDVDEMLRMLA